MSHLKTVADPGGIEAIASPENLRT